MAGVFGFDVQNAGMVKKDICRDNLTNMTMVFDVMMIGQVTTDQSNQI